ncbi:hypothetical protein QJQ45_024159 [Haematococcus lacustris]|nr:hypothetical protein QJQ45_024159 [Haematococcus lacustris]
MKKKEGLLFCPLSGYLLELDANKGAAVCAVSGYSKPLSGAAHACATAPAFAVSKVASCGFEAAELGGIVMEHTTDMEDYRRRYNLEPIVKDSADEELAKGRKRATVRNRSSSSSLWPHCLDLLVDEPCPKCKHPVLEFYTMQLRSADEGQTVFYECTKCGHKYSQNN